MNDHNLMVQFDQEHRNPDGSLKIDFQFAKPGDAGIDLPVVINDHLKVVPHRDYYIDHKNQQFDIPGGGYAEIPCGLAVKVPDMAWGNIKPRSSTAWKRRLVVNEAVIDSGYTGPLFILVFNPNIDPVTVVAGEKLAQLIIIPKFPLTGIVAVEELPKTARGTDGFGSTGA